MSGPVVILVWCVVFDSCGPQFVRVISRLLRVARFSYRVSHSAPCYLGRCLPYRCFRVRRSVCVSLARRSFLLVVARASLSCALVVSSVCIVTIVTQCSDLVVSYRFRGYPVATCFRLFIVFRSGLFVVRILRLFRLAFRSEPFVVASYLLHRGSFVSVNLSLYVVRHCFAVVHGVRRSSS